MRIGALVVLAACGGATVTGTAIEPPELLPEHVTDHHHEAPQHTADTLQLYVEVTSDGDHGDALLQSATTGLGAVSYARPVAAIRQHSRQAAPGRVSTKFLPERILNYQT